MKLNSFFGSAVLARTFAPAAAGIGFMVKVLVTFGIQGRFSVELTAEARSGNSFAVAYQQDTELAGGVNN